MAKKRKAARKSRKAAKAVYMCMHCGFKSSKPGMHCGAMCQKC